MFNGKLKGSLEYFFEDENFGGNLWNSHPYLVWENSKFETDFKVRGVCAVRFGCNAGINLTGYHPLPGLTSGPLIFFIKIPTPGTAFQCKTLAPGKKNETKIPTPGHSLPSLNAKRSMENSNFP